MLTTPTAAEAVKQSPLLVGMWTLYSGFMSTYGTVIVTTFSILYAVLQVYFLLRDKAGWFGGKKGTTNVSD